MTDEQMMRALASLRSQVGAMQATIDLLTLSLAERLEHTEIEKQATTECQHRETEDWGSTLRTSRRRCMNPNCRKIITEDMGRGETSTRDDSQDRDGHSDTAGSADGARTMGKTATRE